MSKSYDLVYLTNTPSFYKLNLCEAIARSGTTLLLVLYGYGTEAVNANMDNDNSWSFDFKFINKGDSNSRNKPLTFLRLAKLMHRVSAKKIIFAGWMAPEYNLYSFLSHKNKNAMVCESSILDVDMAGVSGWIKRKIFNRMSTVLPSGTPHKQLFESVGYQGKWHITGSVGIFNKSCRQPKLQNHPLRYLYVGRLVDVKNVGTLVDVFNRNEFPLTIVGEGPLKEALMSRAGKNIRFTGFIPNEQLGAVYADHDVFILPSTYEPWGLVVEEALYRRLPVIVSDRVGSGPDMVEALGTGEIFKSNDAASLQAAIDKVAANYDRYQTAAEAIDWEEKDRRQVDAYLQLLK